MLSIEKRSGNKQLSRRHQAVFLAAMLLGSWLGMQAVHESGHVIAAWLTGGRVARVVLHPFTISRTDLAENPRPLTVVWAGPIIGVAVPLLAWVGAAAANVPGAYLLRFFAGFCLIANGGYIGAGVIEAVGDAADMLRLGSPVWLLGVLGVATVPTGLGLWHGQGKHFGFKDGRVSRRAAYATTAAALVLTALEFLLGGE